MDKTQAIKDACRGYADYYGDVRRQLTSEFAADSRWTMASLFALNTGGLVALSQIQSGSFLLGIALFLFWFGVALAFVLAIYSQSRTREFNSTISQLEQLYVLGAATGEIDEQEGERLDAAKRRVSTKWAPYIASGSFLAFSAGLVALGAVKMDTLGETQLALEANNAIESTND